MPTPPHQTDQQIQDLLAADEDQLLEQLGLRLTLATHDLPKSAELHPALVADQVKAMGVKDDMKELGLRVLRRWNKSAYGVICGSDPDDAKIRQDLGTSLGLGEAAAIGALTTGLISIGMMPVLAPVLAALLVKRFFNPAIDVFCEFWKEKLG